MSTCLTVNTLPAVLANVAAHVTFLDPLRMKKNAVDNTFYRLTIDVDYVIMVHSFCIRKRQQTTLP